MTTLQLHTTEQAAATGWLDATSQLDATFMIDNSDDTSASGRYFSISGKEQRQIESAAQTLHTMFLAATAKVMASDALLAKFQIPQALWPRIRDSWAAAKRTIAGRFDFAVSGNQIKAFEYNIDTASCLFEAGSTQGRWAKAMGLPGKDAGEGVFQKLVDAWKATGLTGTVHMMFDDDVEERYHTLYMAGAARAAGLQCKMVCCTEGLRWVDGKVADSDGELITQVWKTWAWETVFDQFVEAAPNSLRIVDVLLSPDVEVFEPMWTVVPNNKAILPMLWELFPGHPYLLRAEFELTAELEDSAAGYVTKPIVGRCGQGVTMINNQGSVVASLGNKRFVDKDSVYQEMRALPTVDGAGSVLVCPWIIGGEACGVVLRVDEGLITTVDSPIVCLRVEEERPETKQKHAGVRLSRSYSAPVISHDVMTAMSSRLQLAY